MQNCRMYTFSNVEIKTESYDIESNELDLVLELIDNKHVDIYNTIDKW